MRIPTKVMPETSVGTDLLESFKIISELGCDTIGQQLRVLSVNDITLPVEEPHWDLELSWVLQNVHYSLKLIGVEISGSFAKINICLLANNVGKSTPDT